MQEKEPIMVVWCKLKVPSLRITVWHHSVMLNSYRRDRMFNPQFKNSYNKENVLCSNICYIYIRYEEFFVPT